MKLDKAIELLELNRYDNPDYHLLDFQDAIDLAIEAIKAVKDSRTKWGSRGVLKLPGETPSPDPPQSSAPLLLPPSKGENHGV